MCGTYLFGRSEEWKSFKKHDHRCSGNLRHVAGHSSSNFVCRICKDVFADQTLLDQHFSDYHPTKTSHHCKICNDDFISELFLQIHNTDYHSSTPKTITKLISKSPVKYKSQIRNKSTKPKNLNNSGSVQKFVSNALVKRNDNVFWCPICFKSFSKREDLRGHFRSNHTFASGLVYICELCDIEKPTAEMLCWHLEVHSTNRLSVNRFSKLRSCLSNVKSEDTENCKQQSVTTSANETTERDESLIKTETKVNDLKSLKQKVNLQTCNTSTQEIELKTVDIPFHGKVDLPREKQKEIYSQLESQSFGRRKLNRLSSKKSLLQVKNTTYKEKDEVLETDFRKVRDDSTKMETKSAKPKLLHKLEGYVERYIPRNFKNRRYTTRANNRNNKRRVLNLVNDGDNKERNDSCDLISNKLLCEGNSTLEAESTNSTTTTQSGEEVLYHKTRSSSNQSKANELFAQKDESQSSFEERRIESSVNSHTEKEENVLDNLTKKLNPETSIERFKVQSTVVKSILLKKGKSSFRNLKTSFPTKRKSCYIINTKKSKRAQIIHKDSKPISDKKESNNKRTMCLKSNSTEEDGKLLGGVANTATHASSSENFLPQGNIKVSSQYKMEIISQSASNICEEVSNENHVKVHEYSKDKSECQYILNNLTEGNSKNEDSGIATNENSTDAKVSSEILADDLKNKTQVTCESSNKDSKSLNFEHEEKNKKEICLKPTLDDMVIKFGSDSSGKDVFCAVNNLTSQYSSKQIDSVEILKGKFMEKPGNSSTIFEDVKVNVSENSLLVGAEENSQTVSAIFKCQEKQADKLIFDGPCTLKEVEIKNITLEEKDSKVEQNSENPQNEPIGLYEEIACDKCSLKFYNQDDLFDHLGSHYDF